MRRSVFLFVCTIFVLLDSVTALSWTSFFSSDDDSPDTEDLVSPIVNRELQASVVAHDWPSTPQSILCEAHVYHHPAEQPVFLQRLVELLDKDLHTYKAAYELALQASPLEEGSAKRLLAYSLSLRATSPQCELHRGLAHQTLQEIHPDIQLFAVIHPLKTVILQDQVLLMDWSTLSKSDTTTNVSDDVLLLPGEVPMNDDNKDTRLVILYANLGTTVFQKAYQQLQASSIRFVVRHLGAIHNETATPTVLQGYGVRLDIRNVEYKVFDDRQHMNETKDDGLLNLQDDIVAPQQQFLAGVNLSMTRHTQQLWKLHENQQSQSQIIPPLWQRRKLPLQAATVLTTSTDPLVTLEEISHNLPSVASTLVHVKVPNPYEDWAKQLEKEQLLPALYINGRLFSVDRPTFNVFELLNVLRNEQTALDRMQQTLGPYLEKPSMLAVVQRAWMMGDNFVQSVNDDSDDDSEEGSDDDVFRIDVGRGGKQAIMYLNDIEKDAQYEQWTQSLRQMLMSMQFGMPPAVRRNLFTILAVVDPTAKSENPGLDLGLQLMQSSFPARVGVLMVSEEDIKACAEWVSTNSPEPDVPCPVQPVSDMFSGSLDHVKATAQAVHRLFSQFMSDFQQPGASVAYFEYLLSSIADYHQSEPYLSLQNLMEIHGELLEGMQIMSSTDATFKASNTLTKEEDKDDSDAYLYGKAVRFAVEKGIQPGMAFLNGRPLPTDSDSEGRSVATAFQEEQKHVFGLIVKGEITDNSGSVYAKLLKGNRVFKKAHPLLIGGDDKKDSYLQLDHSFGPDSLLQPKSSTSDPAARFVVEAVLDFDSQAGLELATSLISVLETFPSSLEAGGATVQVELGYRIIPSTLSAAQSPLCPVLAYASSLGTSAVQAALKAFSHSERSLELEKLLASIPGLSDDLRQSIIASGTQGPCSESSYLETVSDLSSTNMVIVNGRTYAVETNTIQQGDIELLFSIELGRAKAVSRILKEHRSLQSSKTLDAAGRVAAFLAVEEESSSKGRIDILRDIVNLEQELDIKDNPLRFTWNADTSQNADSPLKIEVTALVDPVSDSTQRLAPLLRVFRDELMLPLNLILSPASLIDSESKVPITSYYRFVAQARALPDIAPPKAHFSYLPKNHVLTLRVDVPEPWDVQQTKAIQDTDNLLCNVRSGCSDEAVLGGVELDDIPIKDRRHLTEVEYGLNHLLVFGQCYESSGSPPNGLQLTLSRHADLGLPSSSVQDVGIQMDGSIDTMLSDLADTSSRYSDTLVMKNVGYWQLRANPGVWNLKIAEESRGAEIFDFVNGTVRGGRIVLNKEDNANSTEKTLVIKDFGTQGLRGELLFVKRRPGFEKASLFFDKATKATKSEDEVINVFSLATGHLYERFLKIMMLSVTKRTSSKVKFWLFENFLSPTFKESAMAMAERIGCELAFVTYKWPEWLRGQTEKQRIIWGYKILFLDVLFPLDVKKIIYVDADQVIRGDLKELWDMDLKGAAYGYTPFCTSRESTLGYQFWRDGFWKTHLQGRPYHISALYVVDLEVFRRNLVGDQLRAIYQQLSADPNSLSNLDQDLPNYAQHQVPIFSLPQEWLWCESWCSDETKATAKTIDLCNNPMHKEPKVSMAKRVISGPLFNESWVELDAEVERYYQEYLKSAGTSS